MSRNSSPSTPARTTRSGRSFYSPQDRHKKLRQALDQTSNLQEITTIEAVNILKEAVIEVDDIHGDIEDPTVNQDQILLDSEVMKVSSHVIEGCMESLTQETNAYDGSEFANNLHEYMKALSDETVEEVLNWELLSREVSRLFKPVGSYSHSLLHCMEPIAKTEVQKKAPKASRKPRDALMPAKTPDAVVAIENDDNPVDKTVAKIQKLIKSYYKHNNHPLNFFKLIIDPEDFGKTVENMLHVSFLVRDGKVSLVLGEGGHLIIEPVPQHVQEEQHNQEDNNRNAMVPGFTMEKWRLLTEYLDIQEAMINF